MSVRVSPVAGRSDRDLFLKLPWHLYGKDSNWVPPIISLQRQRLSPKANPFFQHAEVAFFLAWRDGDPVGRISAQVDHEHNRYHSEQTGLFGFFECQDDQEVAAALFDAAERWLLKAGMELARGPMSFSINDEVGLLIDGFDSPPTFMMPYNPPYYPALLEDCGYKKAKDLFAWRWDWHEVPRAHQVGARMRQLPDVTVRTLDMKRFEEDVRNILDIFNDAWRDNWGFVPVTDSEAEKLAKDLRLLINPEIVIFAEVAGVPAAVLLALPNLNEAIHDLNGHLLPLGALKVLWRLKIRGLKTARLALMGLRPEYRTRRYVGLTYLLGDEIHRRAQEQHVQWGELGWTLEDNHIAHSYLRKVGCKHYKTYRIYEKALRK